MYSDQKHAAARKAATDDTKAYLATVESLEPDIHPIDASAYYASAAISLKRIADRMPNPVAEFKFRLQAATFITLGIIIGLVFGRFF